MRIVLILLVGFFTGNLNGQDKWDVNNPPGNFKEVTMLDPKLLRSDLNAVADSLKIKRYNLDTEAFLALEAQRRELQLAAESLQQERNAYAKSMGKLIGEAKARGEDIEPLKARGEQIKNDCAVSLSNLF